MVGSAGLTTMRQRHGLLNIESKKVENVLALVLMNAETY